MSTLHRKTFGPTMTLRNAALLAPDRSPWLGSDQSTQLYNHRLVVTLFPRLSTPRPPTALRLVRPTGHNNTDTFVSTLLLTFPPLNS